MKRYERTTTIGLSVFHNTPNPFHIISADAAIVRSESAFCAAWRFVCVRRKWERAASSDILVGWWVEDEVEE